VRWAALALAALALAGCETSAEKSAKLEKVALARLRTSPAAKGGLKLMRASAVLKVTSGAVVHDAEGTAAVVTLHNGSATAEQAVPLEITVHDAGGSALYANTASGISGSLTSVSYIPAHGTTTWVDDQVQVAGRPTSVTAEAGEGRRAGGQAPRVEVHRGEVTQEAGGTEIKGTAVNRSTVTQEELVIYAVSVQGGRTIAAGRAVLPELAGGASAPFSILLIGRASGGAGITLSAPATTLR
jgi:hypothetical protein